MPAFPQNQRSAPLSTATLSNPGVVANIAQLQDLVGQGGHVPLWVSRRIAGDFLRYYGSGNRAVLHPGVQLPGMVQGGSGTSASGPQTTGPGNLPQSNSLGAQPNAGLSGATIGAPVMPSNQIPGMPTGSPPGGTGIPYGNDVIARLDPKITGGPQLQNPPNFPRRPIPRR